MSLIPSVFGRIGPFASIPESAKRCKMSRFGAKSLEHPVFDDLAS